MTTQAITLELASREILGKKVRQLRRAGIMPVHLYGPTVESRALQCETRTLTDALARAGATTPITVSVQGGIPCGTTFSTSTWWSWRRLAW